MAVTIKNKPTNWDREEHLINDHYGFIDSKGNFFLITSTDTIILMNEDFLTYNLSNRHYSIEDFLQYDFDTTLVRAYKKNDFDIIIDLK